MTMRTKIARLFTIKTRFEAYLVTYAIAVGAVERGLHYAQDYPGNGGILLAMACLGVPFIAGAKLLDSVRPVEAKAYSGVERRRPLQQRGFGRRISRSRPTDRRTARGSASPS
jgi:hypothetical protein